MSGVDGFGDHDGTVTHRASTPNPPDPAARFRLVQGIGEDGEPGAARTTTDLANETPRPGGGTA